MADGGTSGSQQAAVLVTAAKKLAARFKAPDAGPFLAATASLAADGVCCRCLLRLTGHSRFEDYALPSPSRAEDMVTALRAGDKGSAQAQPDAGPGGSPSSSCPVCFGLLPLLLDNTDTASAGKASASPANPAPADGNGAATDAAASSAADGAPGAAAQAAAPDSAAAAPAGAGPSGPSGSSGRVDVAWLRLQLQGVAGAAGSRTGPATGHELLRGRPSAAAIAAAVWRQAESGPPDTLEIAAAAAAAAAAAVTEAAASASGADVPMAEASSGGAGGSGKGEGAAGEAAAEVLGEALPVRSFCLEVPAAPAACSIRDASAHAALAAAAEAGGGRCGGWRASEVVTVAAVLRRALPQVLSSRLGLPSAGPQAAELVVSVAALDGGEGREVVKVLVSDLEAHMLRRQQQYMQKQQHQGGRQGRRGGGAGGNKRQRRAGHGHQGPGGHGGLQEGGEEAGEEPSLQVDPQVVEDRARTMGWEQAASTVAGMPRHVLQRLFPWPPGPAQAQAQAQAPASGPQQAEAGPGPGAGPRVFVRAARPPLLLAGRYCKLRRHMPQCPWFDLSSGTRIGGKSVQEAIEDALLPLYGCGSAKMVTGGREDADVRMLGAGRPFVLELQAPLRGHPPAETLRRAEQRLLGDKRSGVSVQGLAPVGKAALDAVKAAEESKEKTYRAVCWAAQPLSPAHLSALVARGRITSEQDTPVRVLHRRAAKVRPKWLQVEAARLLLPGSAGDAGAAAAAGDEAARGHYFVIDIRTQAGTYVKEFCHGDFGRCRPSLGDLLVGICAGAGPGPGAEGAAGAGVAAVAGDVDGAAAGAVGGGGEAAAGKAAANGGAGAGAEAAAGAAGAGAPCTYGMHVEIVQLDVMDVHLEDWP